MPIRFGVLLYSAKVIEEIESNDGELFSQRKDDSQSEEDISSLVIVCISF